MSALFDAAVNARSPWCYFSTTETSGTITDDSGNGRHLTLPGGAPTYAQPGPLGEANALLFPDSSGGTEYYAVTSASPSSTPPFTIMALFMITATPTAPTPLAGLAFGYGNNSRRPIEMYVDTDDKVKLLSSVSSGNNPTILAQSGTVAHNTWHIAFGVFSNGVVRKIRLNKVDVASDSPNVSFTSGSFFFVRGGGADIGGIVNLTNGSPVYVMGPALFQSVLSDADMDAIADAMQITATASLSLSGSAGSTAPSSGTGSLTLSGVCATGQPASGTGSLSISGAATAAAPTAATGSLSLTAGATAVAPAGATAALTLVGVAEAVPLYETDTSNAFRGLSIRMTAEVFVTQVVEDLPSALAPSVEKAIALPQPVLVKGRPT